VADTAYLADQLCTSNRSISDELERYFFILLCNKRFCSGSVRRRFQTQMTHLELTATWERRLCIFGLDPLTRKLIEAVCELDDILNTLDLLNLLFIAFSSIICFSYTLICYVKSIYLTTIALL